MRCARLPIASLLFSFGTTLSACGGDGKPCTSMGTMSDVIGRAALVRLDVYDGGAHCDGAAVSTGAPPPSLSKVAAAGKSIKLDVPAGHHVLVLSAFADGAGSVLLGSACVETDVQANQPACFNLALADAPDAAMAPATVGDDMARTACSSAPDNCPAGQFCASDGNCSAGCKLGSDCAATPTTPLCKLDDHRCVQCLVASDCPAGKQCSPSGSCVDGCVPAAPNCPTGDQCCSNLCIDVRSDVLNCGACGRACSSAHVTKAGCGSNVCAPTCAAGWGDCNHPLTGADDGCETSLDDVAHCGACTGAVCNLPHATPDCPSGSCTVKQCASGWFDCDAKATNGCECPGSDLGGGAGGCCPGGACQIVHADGFGHPFYDCNAVGTYTETLAREAAHAYAPTVTPFGNKCPSPGMNVQVICAQSSTSCACWAWADSATSGPATGRAHENKASNVCYCPNAGDQPWS